MKAILSKSILMYFLFINLSASCQENRIDSIKMHLSSFGVESDDYPSIDVYVNFLKDSSYCFKSFYNPKFKNSHYSLTKEEINSILTILEKYDLVKLKSQYTISLSDQPTSTIILYSTKQKIEIKDYGLKGDDPLPQLYKIAYKF